MTIPIPEIRQYLTSAYGDDELGTLCSDYFRGVYENFTAGMIKAQKIGLLLDYCQRRDQLLDLLAVLERDRPQQYRLHFAGNVVETHPAAPQPQREPQPWPKWLWPTVGGLVGLTAIVVAVLVARGGFDGRPTPTYPTATHIPPIPTETATPTMTASPTPCPDAYEPDDDYDLATMLYLDLPQEHTIHRTSDEDWVKIVITAGHTFEVSTFDLAPGVDTKLWLYPDEAAGSLAWDVLAENDNSPANPPASRIVYHSEADRDFYVQVAHVGKNPGGCGMSYRLVGRTWLATPSPALTKVTTDTPSPLATIAALSPTPGIGSTMVSAQDGMTLVYVPAGEFLMGSAESDSEASSDEKPPHKVTLDAFWIDRTEVPKDQYQKCVDAGKCAAPNCRGTGISYHPVVCVTWQDATNYCAWAGRRLPTEAEWEKAARGTDGRKYPWGNEAVARNLLNFCDRNCRYDWKDNAVDDGYAETAPVGNYLAGASPYDAPDMAGNVWEWVADWYDENYYASSPAQNPKGPDLGQYRVLRGGSWDSAQWHVRAAVRFRGVPDLGYVSFGFRCARSL